MPDASEKDIPLGKKIRDLVNAALSDTRREEIQLKLLDKAFADISVLMPKVLEREFEQLKRHLKNAATGDDEKAALIILTAITTAAQDENIDSPYSPLRHIRVPVSTNFTQVTAQQIRELPGYIKLHEVARELDIAISLGGLTDGEESRGGIPRITVNALKTYDEGADSMYPNLPPRKTKFGKNPSKDFDL